MLRRSAPMSLLGRRLGVPARRSCGVDPVGRWTPPGHPTPGRQARGHRLAERATESAHAGGTALPPAPSPGPAAHARRALTAPGYDRRVLSRRALPIVAIATAPGRGAVGIVRVSGRGLQPLVAGAVRPHAGAAPGHAAAVPGAPTAAPSTRAWRCTFRRRTPTPARTCSSCRRMAARCCCRCCWRAACRPAQSLGPAPGRAGRVHRSARSSTASSTWRRPRRWPT